MQQLRDIQNPTGADIQAWMETFMRENLLQLKNSLLDQLLHSQSPNGGASFNSDEYDFQVCKANHYPGKGWDFLGLASAGIDVYIVWRMSRVEQTRRGLTPIMKMPETPANAR